jgi:hypothetical protein
VQVAGDLQLHLNGHKVTAKAGEILGSMFRIPVGSTMTLFDEALPADFELEYDHEAAMEGEEQPVVEIPTGAVISSRSFSGKVTISSMFMVEGELTIAGGHIDATEINVEDRANGLAVYVCKGGKLNMAGGVVTGGTTWSFLKPEDILDENGEVIGNTAPDIIYGYGGCFYVDKGGECVVSGGTLWKGSAAHGGNIYVAGDETEKGKLTITGGTLLAGESTNDGGNISVAGHVEITGGQMLFGRSFGHGGNIFLSGDMVMDGGYLEGGACDANQVQNKRGGNLAINGLHTTVKISNSTIKDGTASCKETHGGNIACFGYGAVDFVVEDSVITGGKGHRGGNIYIGHFLKDVPLENMDYVFNRTTLGGGSTTYRGSNICTDTKNNDRRILVTFNDCIATVEKAGELSIAAGAGAPDIARVDFIINGGTWTGGGFNIYRYCTVTTNGVTLDGCDASGGGEYFDNP